MRRDVSLTALFVDPTDRNFEPERKRFGLQQFFSVPIRCRLDLLAHNFTDLIKERFKRIFRRVAHFGYPGRFITRPPPKIRSTSSMPTPGEQSARRRASSRSCLV